MPLIEDVTPGASSKSSKKKKKTSGSKKGNAGASKSEPKFGIGIGSDDGASSLADGMGPLQSLPPGIMNDLLSMGNGPAGGSTPADQEGGYTKEQMVRGVEIGGMNGGGGGDGGLPRPFSGPAFRFRFTTPTPRISFPQPLVRRRPLPQ